MENMRVQVGKYNEENREGNIWRRTKSFSEGKQQVDSHIGNSSQYQAGYSFRSPHLNTAVKIIEHKE